MNDPIYYADGRPGDLVGQRDHAERQAQRIAPALVWFGQPPDETQPVYVETPRRTLRELIEWWRRRIAG